MYKLYRRKARETLNKCRRRLTGAGMVNGTRQAGRGVVTRGILRRRLGGKWAQMANAIKDMREMGRGAYVHIIRKIENSRWVKMEYSETRAVPKMVKGNQ